MILFVIFVAKHSDRPDEKEGTELDRVPNA